jgi:Uma2 family endonuclease
LTTAAMPLVDPGLPLPPRGEELYETVNGHRRGILPMGAYAGLVASILVGCLNEFALKNKLGLAVVEVLFRLRADPKLERRPDVAFVSYGKLPDPVLPAEDPAAWDVVPNLAIEVVSPTNTADEIVEKIEEYFQTGVELVWVIYPKQRLVYAYQSTTQLRILREPDMLDGAAVLPGLQLKVIDLFAAVRKP